MANQQEQSDEALIAEIGHVLFIDIVGYSKSPMEEQHRAVQNLQEIVQLSPAFAASHAEDASLVLPTGDGMALVFFRDVAAPMRTATEIHRAAKKVGLQLRMGIHSGPVYKVKDINLNRNVAGGGINIAQRVMDCGDAGHILVSDTVAGFLRQFGDWARCPGRPR